MLSASWKAVFIPWPALGFRCVSDISRSTGISKESTDAVSVAGITTHEDSLVKGVLFSDTLPNGIDRVPLNPVPLNPIWLQNVLRGLLDLLDGGGLSGVPIGVGGGGNLDIEADHVVLAGNDHD